MNNDFDEHEEDSEFGLSEDIHTGDQELDTVINGLRRMNKLERACVHWLFFRFSLDDFAKRPCLHTFWEVLAHFHHFIWPDICYFGFPVLLALLAVLTWAGAMTTKHPALWIACLALAAAAIIKRPVLEPHATRG